MKNTGICGKCESQNVKENTTGGMQGNMRGRLYRCMDCGFSEIWYTKGDERAIIGFSVAILLIAAGAFAYVMMT